jgi:hypothetical protein
MMLRDASEEAEQLARYACAGPPEHALPAVRRLRTLINHWEEQQVAAARGRGWTWGEIARVLGRSRQAVHTRYRSAPAASARGGSKGRSERPVLSLAERNERADRLTEQKLLGAITAEEWLRRIAELDDQLP